ncbi:hypothetical protein DFS34DRAFT_299929 [Phlyctochytrium arcticum]|nr:hypothetical protein DFS34DRAFT_299929 [Phlyctochytrium arcticum]
MSWSSMRSTGVSESPLNDSILQYLELGPRTCGMSTSIDIKLKHVKETIRITAATDARIAELAFSNFRIPPQNLKLICGGRRMSEDANVAQLTPGSTVLILGTPEEDPTGCHPKDITVLMNQMGVDKNTAIKALRRNSFDLVDAMLKL